MNKGIGYTCAYIHNEKQIARKFIGSRCNNFIFIQAAPTTVLPFDRLQPFHQMAPKIPFLLDLFRKSYFSHLTHHLVQYSVGTGLV